MKRQTARPLIAAALWLTHGLSGATPEARLSLGQVLGRGPAELPRVGVNLGGRTVWGAEQLMGNVLRNPGLEGIWDGALVIVATIDGARLVDDSRWTARPEGFWAGARYEVLSGAATGQAGRVLDSARRRDTDADTFTLDRTLPGLQPGDVLTVQGTQDATAAAQWWTQGLVRAAAEPRPGSPGQRSVRLTAGAGQPAALFHHLDSIGTRAGKLLPVRGRWRLALWLRGHGQTAQVKLSFGRQGRPLWLDRTVQPGSAWQSFEWEFDTQDDGPPHPLMLAISVEVGEVQVDDVELHAATAAQPGGFRAEVVDTLRALKPGYLREWQGQLADTPDNRAAPAWARRPIRYRPGAHEVQFAYGLHEFMALAAAVGARPWLVLPATTTPTQAHAFGAQLAAAWRQHQPDEIVVEHGNEHWNTLFRPAGIARPQALAEVADQAFAALRAGAGPRVPLHRVIGTQYVDAAAAGRMAALSRHSEGVAVAPYFHYRQEAGESPALAQGRALHEGVQPLAQALALAAAQGKSVDVYEVNFHTTLGTASASERDAVVTAPASGAALMRRLLQATEAGVTRQAVYQLAGYDAFIGGGSRQLTQLFGITRDLASASQWRPTGAAVVALNRVIAGRAHASLCSGPGCSDVTALAFAGGAHWAMVSSSAQAMTVSWPCQGPQRLQGSAGSPSDVPCRQGRAAAPLPPQSWLTAMPMPDQGR
jgi:hypothetical protein